MLASIILVVVTAFNALIARVITRSQFRDFVKDQKKSRYGEFIASNRKGRCFSPQETEYLQREICLRAERYEKRSFHDSGVGIVLLKNSKNTCRRQKGSLHVKFKATDIVAHPRLWMRLWRWQTRRGLSKCKTRQCTKFSVCCIGDYVSCAELKYERTDENTVSVTKGGDDKNQCRSIFIISSPHGGVCECVSMARYTCVCVAPFLRFIRVTQRIWFSYSCHSVRVFASLFGNARCNIERFYNETTRTAKYPVNV